MKTTVYWNKALKAMQEYYRRKKLKCLGCGGNATVMHHWSHSGSSVALRLEERNLVPLCASCHYKVHKSAPLDLMRRIRGRMEEAYAPDWEDVLISLERAYTRRPVKDMILWLKEKTLEYKRAE